MNELIVEVADLLRYSGLTLSVAESCSGGLLSKYLTDIPGSSEYFLLGVVSYSDIAKQRVLGVPETVISAHGAVSAPTARAMATGIRRLSRSDIAIATTGIAGPTGGTPDKPVGTVFIALADASGESISGHLFEGDRLAVREATVIAALIHIAERLKKRSCWTETSLNH